MATRRPAGTRAETIHCEFCGEDYAATYKRCPFCDGRPGSGGYDGGEEYEDDRRGGGGKRLRSNTRGGGYGGGSSPFHIILTVLSIALIVAAVCIVVSFIKPLVDKGNTPPIDPDNPPTPSQSQQVQPSGTPGPDSSNPPEGSQPPASEAPTDVIPAGQTATSFTVSPSDFTMNDKYPEPVQLKVTFSPSGSTGTITWTSASPDVATVDENGKVSRGTKNGSAIITATMAGGFKQEITVRCNFTGAAANPGTGTGTGTGTGSGTTTATTLELNREDFTLSKAGETFKMKVSGTSSTPTWSIGNTGVATIASDGTVTAVSRGDTTITCTVDGQVLTCMVRCRF